MAIKKIKKSNYIGYFVDLRLVLLSFGFVILAVGITYIIYLSTITALKHQLQQRILAIASTAAAQFDFNQINKAIVLGTKSSQEFEMIVSRLRKIKEANPAVKYAYLLRKLPNKNSFAFIADALSLSDDQELDENFNGTIEEDEVPPEFGEEYDASEYPALRDEASYHPAVDSDLQADKWGLMMAAYAPIVDSSNNTIAVLGVDVIADDFLKITRSTFLPFLFFILFLVLLIGLLTFILMRVYTRRVMIVQDLDRQKDELLGMVSHQLAKPITAIKWNLESMLDGDTGPLSADQKESAITMRTMAANLSDLVSMILDVSRVQMGKIKLDPQPMDLNHLFKEIFDIVAPTIAEKKITFEVSMEPIVLPTALLDRRYTRMTFENLITNAVKYTAESGTVKLRLRIMNGRLHFSISDTGYGIPKAEQGKIFGKMYRASNVRNTQEGNGFGLYVAKGAVEGQNGKIWFESTEGKGTTFYVDLPVKVVT